MTDQSALLAAILAYPEDDTPRLVFADWLDENEASVTCEACGGSGDDGGHAWDRGMVGVCNRCNGSGFVSNGYAAKSEFIRVQCELATFDGAYYLSFDNCKMCEKSEIPLIKRSAELLHKAWSMSLIDMQMRDVTVFNAWVFRRGFVDSVSCPWESWRDYGDVILAAHPVTKVRLTTWPPFRWQMDNLPPDWPNNAGFEEMPRRVALDAFRHRWPSVREWVLPPDPNLIPDHLQDSASAFIASGRMIEGEIIDVPLPPTR